MEETDPLVHPIARAGEQQFACICRQRSGIDSGNITEVTRPFHIEKLCDADQRDAALSALNLAITVLKHCKRDNIKDLTHWVDLIAKQVSPAPQPPTLQPGQEVLVWAVVGEPWSKDAYDVADWVRVTIGGHKYGVPLSSIHPAPAKKGETT